MLQEFTISELSFSVMTMSGGVCAILVTVWKSRCKTIDIAYGCIRCDRDVPVEKPTPREDVEMGIPPV